MRSVHGVTSLSLSFALVAAVGCARATAGTGGVTPSRSTTASAPVPDPRIGLRAGLWDAAEATWNMRVLSETRPSERFVGSTNSDLAFLGHYAIQGNYNGYQVWDIADPAHPRLEAAYYCPASQSDVSVYRNLLFVSGEGLGGRLDCGGQGVPDTVSRERLRGIRIFDVTDLAHPRYVANVQTCRGSHTHSLLVDPRDPENVYVYVSGSAGVRSPNELPGCSGGMPGENPGSALFRIEVIRVPLAHPEQAAIVSSPRIFNDLVAPPHHGGSAADRAEAADARAHGKFTADIMGEEQVLPDRIANYFLDSLVKERGGSGAPTAADSSKLRQVLPTIVARLMGRQNAQSGPTPGPTQCHDITLYPAIGLAGGACEGYGLLLDIHDPAHPVRLAAASDSNFSYWHSATFNNDGTKVLFSDEWGGGGQPKCRASDPREWGADAIFTLSGDRMNFQSYYKLPAPQTPEENCVAHNGSLVPVPGRDVMVQAWYQGGVSVFDFTDAARPREIAFFDRGPVDASRMEMGGSWSAYWYNGVIVSSEIARGLDLLELTPSPLLTANEIDAAKTARLDYLNVQGQQKYVWPATVALARAYADQLERSGGLSGARLAAVREALGKADGGGAEDRREALGKLAAGLDADAAGSRDAAKVRLLAGVARDLAR